jgi:two-component system, OmpR family, manganese sensing response regulator
LQTTIVELLQHENHEVDTATRGDDAMNLLLHYSYDAAVLDWEMPVHAGIDICKHYRAQGGKAPILFLTGRSDTKSRVAGLDSGGDDYLCKPFDTNEFLARVRALLRREPTQPVGSLTVGSIVYEPSSKTVYFNNNKIALSKKEISILEFFLRHPNQTFTVEAIVERVWRTNTTISSETVRPYIKRLRDKLSDKQGNSPLVNVYGSGYKLTND